MYLFEEHHSTHSDDPIWLVICFFFPSGNHIAFKNYIPNVYSEYLMLLKYIFISSQKENYSVSSAIQGVDPVNSIPFWELE